MQQKEENTNIRGSEIYKIRVSKSISTRSKIIFLIMIAIFVAVIFRLYYLQVVAYDKYHQSVVGNSQAYDSEKSTRGLIYDADGNKLTSNNRVYTIYINPKGIIAEGNSAEVCSLLEGFFEDVTYEQVSKIINDYPEKYSRPVLRKVPEEQYQQLNDLITEKNLGRYIFSELTYSRYYPYGSLASHVIGFCGTDGGLAGLELYYNDYLTGTDGTYVFSRDAIGQSIISDLDTIVEAKNGNDINSTLRIRLQSILEAQLRETYKDSKPGEGGKVIGLCMDVNTSAVLAMATYPTFDLNDPYTLNEYAQAALDSLGFHPESEDYKAAESDAIFDMWRNVAVSDTYEPGSTFKLVTASASLEERAVEWDSPVWCSGYVIVDGQKIHCHKAYGHRGVTFKEGLQLSCNPTLMAAAMNLGKEKFYSYLEDFGYMERTGIDLPGEAKTIYTDYSSATNVNLAYMAFGQTIKVTPIRQLSMVCTIANGGYLRTPYLVQSITDQDGNLVYTKDTTPIRQVISTNICKELTEVLREGVASPSGAARNAYVSGYRIAAKTGTSEVLDILNEDGEPYLRIGSCTGYAPADDPQIAAIIIVQYPMGESIYGNYVAAPYLANFFDEALPYIGVERKLTEEEEAKSKTTLRNYVGLSVASAVTDLTNRKIKYQVLGNGDTVTYQTPTGGTTISKSNGKVLLYSGTAVPDMTVEVPDIIGFTPAQAQYRINRLGLNIVMSGMTENERGVQVVSQSPAAGTIVNRGEVVSVTCKVVGNSD